MKRWLRQRRLTLTFFGLIALGAAVFLYLPLHHQAVACNYSSENILPNRPTDHQRQAKGEQTSANQTQQAEVAQGQEQQANDYAGNSNIKQRGWFDKTVCDSDVTDIALVFFTYCLVIVGWATMRSNEVTVREIERARLAGAPWPEIVPKADGSFDVGFRIVNSGKTLAILKEIRYRFSLEGPAGKRPVYDGFESMPFDNMLEGGFNPEGPCELLSSPYGGTQFCYGFIRYLDIFGESHISRFCCKLDMSRQRMDATGPSEWSRDD